ncbi:hypothetical protein [uncultured Flavobacterium sp.]|uniref:hypothetical protein n=1 Tax=uncultured Flavobacterium sp. TaxID=165435 RepID=UPI0030EC5A9B
MEANTTSEFKTTTSTEKQSTLTSNDNSLKTLGLLNESHFQISAPHLNVSSTVALKKYILKFLYSSSISKEKYFSNKVNIIWTFCNQKEIFFSAVQVIFPFHYFW